MVASTAPSRGGRGFFAEPREDWLKRHTEDILDPARPIVDPHHHLWDHAGEHYMLNEITDDVASGHNVVATVYIECRSMYRADGPEAMKPVGEVEFANGIAAQSASGAYGKTSINAGIVGHANLLLGGDVRAVLEAEIKAGNGRLKGIRHSAAWDADPAVAGADASRPKGLLMDETFRKGLACLAPLGLTFDTWILHPQIDELTHLAKNFPNQTIILDHCGGFVGIRGYKNKHEENFARWKASIKELAKCENVVVKLGGLAMNFPGFGFEHRDRPPTSEELAQAWKPHIEVCIEAFGVKRSMFESNFPPDKGSCSYQVLWNAFKRLSAGFSEDEKTSLFSATAAQTYTLALKWR